MPDYARDNWLSLNNWIIFLINETVGIILNLLKSLNLSPIHTSIMDEPAKPAIDCCLFAEGLPVLNDPSAERRTIKVRAIENIVHISETFREDGLRRHFQGQAEINVHS